MQGGETDCKLITIVDTKKVRNVEPLLSGETVWLKLLEFTELALM